jgi:hypothetical protein
MLNRVRTWWNFRRAVKEANGGLAAPSGDKDIVLLPCWRRPEFLWHCLDNLSKAHGVEQVNIVARLDTGFAAENLEVIRGFSDRLPNLRIQYPTLAPYRRTKQSANVLLGYLLAASVARRSVYLVEEDIMVARDFFLWHRAVHAAAARPLFCSIAVCNPNRKVELPNDLAGFYLSTGDYCSTGSCFDKQVLRSMVAPHVRMGYLRRPKPYIRREFPSSAIGLGFVEQDGLIRRIQERSNLPIAWPCVPRAFHSGFYGYNRSGGLEGSLKDRIVRLSETIYDADRMRDVAAGSQQHPDTCAPCELDLPAWTDLHELQVPPPGSASG